MKRLLELITSLLLLLTAICPAYCSGDCQEEIREISIRQYKNLSPLRDQFPQGIPVFRAPGSTARGAVQKMMIQKRKSRL